MIQVTDNHVFFYTEWPSNFFRANFNYTSRFNGEEHEFFCSEQAFMYEKAVVFGDQDAASKILAAYTPAEAKQLGRTVRNFDTNTWEKYRYEVMRDVNLAKYRQNPDLAKRLLDTRFDGRNFVEASPVDSIWGILMPMGAPGIDDEENWRGRNLLGKAITEVRDILKEEACST